MTTTEITITITYRAAGFTDEVTECDICGKVDLKGTVRLELVDPDGGIEGEVYAGVVCAARRSGRKAAAIRDEARAADTARDKLHNEWRDALNDYLFKFGDRLLAEWGLPRLRNYDKILADPSYKAARVEWLAAHPEPTPARGYPWISRLPE